MRIILIFSIFTMKIMSSVVVLNQQNNQKKDDFSIQQFIIGQKQQGAKFEQTVNKNTSQNIQKIELVLSESVKKQNIQKIELFLDQKYSQSKNVKKDDIKQSQRGEENKKLMNQTKHSKIVNKNQTELGNEQKNSTTLAAPLPQVRKNQSNNFETQNKWQEIEAKQKTGYSKIAPKVATKKYINPGSFNIVQNLFGMFNNVESNDLNTSGPKQSTNQGEYEQSDQNQQSNDQQYQQNNDDSESGEHSELDQTQEQTQTQEQDGDSDQQQQQDQNQYQEQQQQVDNQDQDYNRQEDDLQQKGDFQQFTNEFSKNYEQQQKNFRQGMFVNNMQRAKEHNQKRKSYKLEQNQFADLSIDEFYEKYLMQDPPQLPAIKIPPMAAPADFEITPIDWRDKMTQAKHQGKCGSCWAFSVIGVMETMYNIQKQEQINMSVQQLVDCCKSGCNGCHGGWPVSALQFLAKKGVSLQQDYPYKSQVQNCNKQVSTIDFLQKQNPYSVIGDISALAFALESAPVSVIVDASRWDPLYRSGVFDDCPEKNISFNHAVICVGVDQDGNWIVRNSWGSKWGDGGHIYLQSGNSCGIADMGVIPNFSTFETGLGMAAPF